MPSENTIYFYPGRGGHSHDGNNSSFIDTSVYSLFDFSWGEVGDPDRVASQRINYNAFRNFVIDTVNGSILEPSGLVLQPGMVNGSAHIISRSIEADTIAANTLTANEIAANTITSNEIAANFVLVNTVIASSDFNGTYDVNTFTLSNTGTDGWAITSAGDAVFTNGLFRGNLFVGNDDYWYSNGAFALGGNTGIYRNVGGGITLGSNVTITGGLVATSVATPGVDILSNGTLIANTFALYGNGAIVTSSGNFSVDASGNLYAENATIYGEINATSGSINGSLVAGTIDSARIVASASDTVYINQAGTNIPIVIGTLPSGVDMRASGIIVYGGAYAVNTHITGGAISTSGTSRANYFIGSGTVSVAAINSTNLRRRDSDGYFLIEASKRELKKDISTIENCINLIQKLNPVSFRWKDESSYDYYADEIKDAIKSKKEYGFIAEDVESEIPDLAVYESIEDGSVLIPSMWQQNGMIALCVGSIKELLSKINTLERRIQELENGV